ncbi:MAG: LysR family transcriptional regulator, partial [Paracoccaceae bacterium]
MSFDLAPRKVLNEVHVWSIKTISCMMNEVQLHRLDLNLLVTFEALMDARSVSLAARKLGKTPSAVSHALARLRDQVGDPLLVKVGGKMRPSPFALTLIEDVRP